MRLIKGSLAGLVLTGILAMMPAPGLMGQTNVRAAGFPQGPTLLPYPLISTPANDAWARNNAWAAYNAQLRQIPTAPNPNRLAPRENLLDQYRFIQMPTSTHRYHFQF